MRRIAANLVSVNTPTVAVDGQIVPVPFFFFVCFWFVVAVVVGTAIRSTAHAGRKKRSQEMEMNNNRKANKKLYNVFFLFFLQNR